MEQRKYLQSYELNCTFNSSAIEDPYNNIHVNIQQNHQEFDEQWLFGPNFIRENKLVFLPTEERTFNGGNEFRFFDIRFRILQKKGNFISQLRLWNEMGIKKI